MKKTNSFNLENLTPEQKKNIDNLFVEIQFLDESAWIAIDNPEKMTQSIFDQIQLRRMEIGSVLEDIATSIFLQYPEFAVNYADRLERAFCSQDRPSISSPYENIRHGILSEFGSDIGPSA